MTPFRSPAADDERANRPSRTRAPRCLAAGGDADRIVVLLSEGGTAEVVELLRAGGFVSRKTLPVAVGTEIGARCAIAGRSWAWLSEGKSRSHIRNVGDSLAESIQAESVPSDLDDVEVIPFAHATSVSSAWFLPHGATHRHRGCAWVQDTLSHREAPPVPVPSSARHLIDAVSTVLGPVLVFATDHADEIDLLAVTRESPNSRTVSLFRGQTFACAAGGGHRVLLVSRDDDRLTFRTVAADLRSELNRTDVPIARGATVTDVRCAFANGPFVIAHAESKRDSSRVVLTTIDDGAIANQCDVRLDRVDGLAVHGRDVDVLAVVPGAAGAIVVAKSLLRGGGLLRSYAFPLAPDRAPTAELRRAVLTDVADAIAISLGAPDGGTLEFRSGEPDADVVLFAITGLRTSQDVSFAAQLRADGGGVVTARVGSGAAPAPFALGFAGRLREWFSGDDDGDPQTTRVVDPCLPRIVPAVVSAVGALRSLRVGE